MLAILWAGTTLTVALVFPLLSDEGRLTFIGAQLVHDAPVDAFFFQKIHPSLSLFYAPFAALGWPAFITAHVLLAGLAISLLSRFVDELGGEGWLAALILAASPAFFFSAESGQSNSDGIVLLVLALYLLRRPGALARLAAGTLLGAMCWARYEFTLFTGGLALYALFVRRDRAVVAGLLVFPVGYLAGGALYHHSLFWWLAHPPIPATPPPNIAATMLPQRFDVRAGLRLLLALSCVTPVWFMAVWLTPRRRPAVAVIVIAVTLLLFAIAVAVPILGIEGFEHSPRYLSVMLPGFALLLGVSRPPPAWLQRLRWPLLVLTIAAAIVLSFVLPRTKPWHVLVALLPFAVPALSLFVPRRPELFAGTAVAGALLVFLVPSALRSFEHVNQVREAAVWLGKEAESKGHHTVYTDVKNLDSMARAQHLPLEVRFFPSFDQLYELAAETNHENGQYARLIETMVPHFYGSALWPCEVPSHAFAKGEYLLLSKDWRNSALLPPGIWDQETELVKTFPQFTIRVFREDVHGIAVPDLPAWISPEVVAGPCSVAAVPKLSASKTGATAPGN